MKYITSSHHIKVSSIVTSSLHIKESSIFTYDLHNNLYFSLFFSAWCDQHKKPWCKTCDIPQYWCSHGNLPSAQCQDCPGLARCGTVSTDESGDHHLPESLHDYDASESLLAGKSPARDSDKQQHETRVPEQVQPIDNPRVIDLPNTYLVHLNNVSSKRTRQIFVNYLTELVMKREATLQMAWITWLYPALIKKKKKKRN